MLGNELLDRMLGGCGCGAAPTCCDPCGSSCCRSKCCRMGLLAVGILHWIVFYLLTQTGTPPVAGSGNLDRVRTFLAQHAVHTDGVDTPRSV